jgi:hypothetical protein
MLSIDPLKRPSAAEVAKDSWIDEVDNKINSMLMASNII